MATAICKTPLRSKEKEHHPGMLCSPLKSGGFAAILGAAVMGMERGKLLLLCSKEGVTFSGLPLLAY